MQQRQKELEDIICLWQRMSEEERYEFWRRVLHEAYALDKVLALASQEIPPKFFDNN